jgi:hypothetical protein
MRLSSLAGSSAGAPGGSDVAWRAASTFHAAGGLDDREAAGGPRLARPGGAAGVEARLGGAAGIEARPGGAAGIEARPAAVAGIELMRRTAELDVALVFAPALASGAIGMLITRLCGLRLGATCCSSNGSIVRVTINRYRVRRANPLW